MLICLYICICKERERENARERFFSKRAPHSGRWASSQRRRMARVFYIYMCVYM